MSSQQKHKKWKKRRLTKKLLEYIRGYVKATERKEVELNRHLGNDETSAIHKGGLVVQLRWDDMDALLRDYARKTTVARKATCKAKQLEIEKYRRKP